MVFCYFIVLSLVLGSAFLYRRAVPFAACMVGGVAVSLFLERASLSHLLVYLDTVTAWAIILLALREWKAGFAACAYLAVGKVIIVHLGFNAMAHLSGGWWSPVGEIIQLPYMWSLNFNFLAMAVCLHWGMNVRSIVGVLSKGIGRVFGSSPRRHYACSPLVQKVGP